MIGAFLKKQKWLVLILFALWTGFLAYKVKGPKSGSADRPESRTESKIRAGEISPDFTLADLSGKKHSLSDYREKFVVLNFFATWCPPCRAEIPEFVEYAQKHKDVIFLGVDLQEPASKVKPFVEKYKIEYPILLDPDGKIGELYNVQGIPLTVIVDKEGKAKDVTVGQIPDAGIYFDRIIFGKGR